MTLSKAAIAAVVGVAALFALRAAWGGEEGPPVGGLRGRQRRAEGAGPRGPERPGPGRRPGLMGLPFAQVPAVRQELERHTETLRKIMEGQREALRGLADEMRQLRQQGATPQEIREAVKKHGPQALELAGKLADEFATHYANMAKIITDNREAVVNAVAQGVRERIQQRRRGGPGQRGEGPPGRGPRGGGPRGRGPRPGGPGGGEAPENF